MKNFWQTLPEPFFALAPMENVTDTAFRQTVIRAGRPDIFFTEFTSTDGICSKGFKGVRHRLVFEKNEHPIMAQIWGNTPEHYFQSAKLLKKMGFDGIDINMGCPVRGVVKKGFCGGLINNPELAKQIIQATKDGAGNLPVSVKTRIGYGKIQTEVWAKFLLEQNIDALTIHGRTVSEMAKVPAHWDEIGKVVALRNKLKKSTVIIGNGDVESYEDALEKYKTYGVDGIMVGRGIFHNLWLFSKRDLQTIPQQEKIEMLINHISLFEKTWKKQKPFEIMKKFYKTYLSGFPNASDTRLQLMQLKTPQETIDFLSRLTVR